MCNGGSEKQGPKWKREYVQDHKFDYIDMDEFYDPSCTTKIGYLSIFLVIFKSFLVYIADLWTGVSLLMVGQTSDNESAAIPPNVSKWIFLGAILISFLLLFWDIRKSRMIIASRDISWAFTSVIASRYYSVKDYKYYCLFWKINSSRKFVDGVAFFVFFTLKGWKRLLLAEAPRQVINVVTLKALIPKWIQLRNGTLQVDNTALGKTLIQQIMTGTMAFSVLMFAISFLMVCAATIVYIPLLCHIQGNLKEYCCHKVDKRIAYLLRKQAKKRVNGLHQKNKKDDIEMKSFPQPTLPQINDNNNNTYLSSGHGYQQQYGIDDGSRINGGGRRYSGSSYSSNDQLGLTANAQPQAWTPQPYYSNDDTLYHQPQQRHHHHHHQSPQHLYSSPYQLQSPQISNASIPPSPYQTYQQPYYQHQPQQYQAPHSYY
ncbi:uncharacterized protein BX664DRAFT_338236 [Halteromyces radiatus]|uniref:uncharacterized protein n=1 Tax=Halteromyces radiatus TaxID=101107 RepID=UPI0022206193|nr:uncharacterized protein BX664DRAFT_338236 [Halteromyces radiatus]KAI8084974.1 hypothetical protein BX664DRAFT_338236 [Halteromyces radiatus]